MIKTVLSFVSEEYYRRGEGGGAGGLLTFFPWKGGGGVLEEGLIWEGGLIEDLQYLIFFIIRLWEAGWKGRYYQNKFHITENEEGYDDFRKKVVTFLIHHVDCYLLETKVQEMLLKIW